MLLFEHDGRFHGSCTFFFHGNKNLRRVLVGTKMKHERQEALFSVLVGSMSFTVFSFFGEVGNRF